MGIARRNALYAGVAMLLAALGAVLLGRSHAPEFHGFLPAVMGSVIVTELMSAYLLLAQFAEGRSKALAFAGCAYLLAGLLAVPYLLTFPNVFSPGGLFGANVQTAVSLWFLWHLAFPCLVFLYAYAHGGKSTAAISERRAKMILKVSIGSSILGSVLAAYVATAFKGLLPVFIYKGQFSAIAVGAALPAVCAADVAAIVAMLVFTGARNAMQLYLCIAVLASLLDAAIGILCARYTIGWYSGKIFALISSAAVLAQYFVETTKLNARLRLEIAERKGAQVALAAARDRAIDGSLMKSQFVATMSHEIRTPMSGVIGMAELLLETDLTAEQRDYASTIQNSGQALIAIINDILDFSKMEAGQLEIQDNPFALEPVVADVVALLSARATVKGLALHAFVDPKIPQLACGDEGRLRQVLLNLVGNALKFTPEGHVLLRALCVDSDAARVRIRFEIEDTGIGLSESASRRIFEPFVQADGSTSRKFGGTGLGLSISKRLVELMGGSLGVEARQGGGSIFWIDIPFRHCDEIATAMPRHIDGATVLLISEDAISAEIIETYFDAWGVAAVRAGGLADAHASLQDRGGEPRHFDLAIVDADSVGRTPSQCRELLDLAPTFPILSIGAPGARNAGGQTPYVTKPLQPSMLFDAMVTLSHGADAVAQAAPAPRTADTSYEHLRGLKILLAEDNAINQRLALVQLAKLDMDVRVVTTGREAVEAARNESFDAILMDCQMPEMDGYEATGLIRDLERATGAHVPIIAMTANALEQDRNDCIAAGMDDFLSKPARQAELYAVIARWAGPPEG